jgi:hypothetical protein
VLHGRWQATDDFELCLIGTRGLKPAAFSRRPHAMDTLEKMAHGCDAEGQERNLNGRNASYVNGELR